jgi:hypothetical protein
MHDLETGRTLLLFAWAFCLTGIEIEIEIEGASAGPNGCPPGAAAAGA